MKINQITSESTGNIGTQIRAAYKKIYDAGDDAVEFAYYDSPIFAQYWDEYEGDLDSIIAEVDPSELQIILDELTAAAEDQGLAEGSLNEFVLPGGGGGDNYGGDLHDILMAYISRNEPELLADFGEDEIDSVVADMVTMGMFDDIDPNNEEDLEDALDKIIDILNDDLPEQQGVAEAFDLHAKSTSNTNSSPELRGVYLPGAMKHPDWKEPTWSFQEIAQKLGVSTRELNGLVALYPGFPTKVQGIKSKYGSGAYYPRSEVKRWVNATDIRNILKSKKGVAEAGEWTRTPSGDYINMHTGVRSSSMPKKSKPRAGNRMSDIAVGSPKIVHKNGRAVGEIGLDHDPSPGQGPYYMKHYETNTWYSGYDTKKEALADLKHVVDQMNEDAVARMKNLAGLK